MILLYSSISPKALHYSLSYWFIFNILKYIYWTNFRTVFNGIIPSKKKKKKDWYFYCTNFLFVAAHLLKSSPTLLNPMDCSMSRSPILHCIPQFTESRIHWVSDAIQPSHSLLPSALFALNLSQHQGLFQWDSSLHQVVKVFMLQHQFFQWIFLDEFL